MNRACLLLVLLAVPSVEAADDPALDAFDREALKTLSATRTAGPLVYHYEPGALAAERLDSTVGHVGACFDRMQKRLEQPFAGRLHVFLYRDEASFRASVGAQTGVPAVLHGDRSLHQMAGTVAADGLLMAIARQFPPIEDAIPPEPFFVQGLTAMVLGDVEGESPHTWAAVCLRTAALPPLLALRRDWSGNEDGPARPSILAGSFLAFLAERHGISKLKTLYGNCLEFHRALGRSFAQAEKDWLEYIATLPVEPGVEAKLRALLGAVGTPLPAWIATGKVRRLFDGKTLAGWSTDVPKTWDVIEERLGGESPDRWSNLFTTETFAGTVAIRARVRLREGNSVALILNRREGAENKGILARWSAFMTTREGMFAANDGCRIPPGVFHDVLFVNENGNGRLYLNGALVIEREGALFTEPGAVGVAVSKGKADFASVEVITP